MADYKTIKGFNIQSVSSDPSNLSEGEIWYNTTSSTIKGYATQAGTWATGGVLPSPRGNFGACGTLTATVMAAGYDGPAGVVATTLKYDGTSWTIGNSLNQPKSENMCFGTQTTAVSVAGILGVSPGAKQSTVEEYDGTNWTEVTNLPTATSSAGTAGSLTAGLVMGGATAGAPTGTTASFEYDGTNWTDGGAISTGRYRGMGQSIGLQTAALFVGAAVPPVGPGALVESYNGTAWTAGGDLNTGRELGGGNGTQASAMAVSGRLGAPTYAAVTNVEEYDGSTWTEVTDVSTARGYCSATGSGAGTIGNTESLFMGGATTGSTPNTTATEEWTKAVAVVTFTAS